MSKSPRAAAPAAGATRARPTDKQGHQLDEHGLPVNGPARIRALAGKPDPRGAPQAQPIAATTAAAPTEQE